MKRRKFFQTASLVAAGMSIPVGVNSWVAKGVTSGNRKRAIVVFLRGAVDGLSLVVPHQDREYYLARPTLAIPAPRERGGVLDLDGYFGLNPDLVDLMPLWKKRSLAFIHASGSPNETRSHFDAQYYMETGIPGDKTAVDGWMNRLLAVLPKDRPTQAVNLGKNLPRILEGEMPVANLPEGRGAIASLPTDRSIINNAFDQLYNGDDPVSRAYQEAQKSRKIILDDLRTEMIASSGGAPSSSKFALDAIKIARLMRGDAKTQLGFIALGGWDTHVNQKPNLRKALKPLGEGLAALVKELDSLYQDTVIIVMSEFGRTVAENGNLGTDHGHGNVMWLLGGGVRGGKVYGTWPGLNQSQLHQGRDLAVTTDFRDAIASLLEGHLQISQSDLKKIFPGYTPSGSLNLIG